MYTIKKLKWIDLRNNQWNAQKFTIMFATGSEKYHLGWGTNPFDTLDEAKNKAQELYEVDVKKHLLHVDGGEQ